MVVALYLSLFVCKKKVYIKDGFQLSLFWLVSLLRIRMGLTMMKVEKVLVSRSCYHWPK